MSLPGFTAETSLYKTKKHYQGAGSFPRLNKAISPAQGQVTPWPVGVLDLPAAWAPETQAEQLTFGLVKGEAMENKFYACLNRCRAGAWHPTAAACQRTCCREVTGNPSCYVA
jgi:hypothetical protein